jgi:Putative DNA-binding domain
MKDLASIQTAFQNAIVAGNDGVLAEVDDGARQTRGMLVDIYRKAYLLRLLEAVRGRNRILAAHLGDAAFDALARSYINTVPSRHTSLGRFCSDLPAFLQCSAPYSNRPVIADLARIAEALAEAFEAPDHAVLAASDLAIALPGTATDFVVVPHPSVRRLTLLSNAAAIWLALESAIPSPSEIRCSEPQSLIVWRQHATAMFRPLCPAEATIWDAASAGTSVRTLCGTSAQHDDSSVTSYLSAWAAEGLLADLVAR